MAMKRQLRALAERRRKIVDSAGGFPHESEAPKLFQILEINDGGKCDIGGKTPDICKCSLCWAGRRLNRNA